MAKFGTGAQRVMRRRDKLRAAGLRPLLIWVPDTSAAGFAAACSRQIRLVLEAETAASRADGDAWFEISDQTGWTA